MSTPKKKKKVVVSTKKDVKTSTSSKKKKLTPTTSRKQKVPVAQSELIFGRENFKWIFIGLAFIVLGMFLMAGGSMPSPDVWDDSLIYSPRRITLAPIVIIIGLGIEIYAIFK